MKAKKMSKRKGGERRTKARRRLHAIRVLQRKSVRPMRRR